MTDGICIVWSNKGWDFMAFCTDRCIPLREVFPAQICNSTWNCILCRVYNRRPYSNIIARLVINASSMLTLMWNVHSAFSSYIFFLVKNPLILPPPNHTTTHHSISLPLNSRLCLLLAVVIVPEHRGL
jgi:hypothetical protein